MFGFGSSELKAGKDYRVKVSVGSQKFFGGLKIWDYEARYVPDEGETEDDVREQMGQAAMARWRQHMGPARDLHIVSFSIERM